MRERGGGVRRACAAGFASRASACACEPHLRRHPAHVAWIEGADLADHLSFVLAKVEDEAKRLLSLGRGSLEGGGLGLGRRSRQRRHAPSASEQVAWGRRRALVVQDLLKGPLLPLVVAPRATAELGSPTRGTSRWSPPPSHVTAACWLAGWTEAASRSLAQRLTTASLSTTFLLFVCLLDNFGSRPPGARGGGCVFL